MAQTYYQLGNATGAYQVTATLQGILAGQVPTVEVFDATAVSGSRSASLVVVSGDNQRSDTATHDVEDPLVVRVRRPGGYRISNVILRFTAIGGVLEAAPGTKYVATGDVTELPSARGATRLRVSPRPIIMLSKVASAVKKYLFSPMLTVKPQ